MKSNHATKALDKLIDVEEKRLEKKGDKPTVEDVYKVCRAILARSGYVDDEMDLARVYARVALNTTLSENLLKTHILYLLANLNHWKGVEATECKTVLEGFIRKED